MAKYFFQASYVGEGPKGLLKEGGSKRRETVANLIAGMGGTLESFYYAFGEDDVVAVSVGVAVRIISSRAIQYHLSGPY